MNEKDKRCAETIIDYCNRIDDYLNRFDDDKEIYMSDSLYKDACALVISRLIHSLKNDTWSNNDLVRC